MDQCLNKKVYIWNMIGSVCNALASVVFLMIVTRTLNSSESDIFSIGFAISQLLYSVASFQVRDFQSTDATNQFTFTEYIVFRVFTSIAMVVTSVIYIAVKGYVGHKATIVFLLCLLKMVEAGSDVIEGMLQQKMRLDLSGKIVTCRIVPAMIFFLIGLMLTENLTFGCVLLIIVAVVATSYFAFKYVPKFECIEWHAFGKKKTYVGIWAIFYKCLPLFVNGFLASFIFNIPKNSIDKAIELGILQEGSQTIYSILFMPAFAISLFFIFFRPQITQMAFFLKDKLFKKMTKTIVRLATYILAFTALVCIGGYLLGTFLLSLLYGIELSDYKLHLVGLLLGGGLSTLATLWGNVLTILRKQHLTVIGYALSGLSVYFISDQFIFGHDLMGAVEIFLISMLTLCAVTFVIMLIECIKTVKSNNIQHQEHHCGKII